MERHALRDDQFARIENLLPGRPVLSESACVHPGDTIKVDLPPEPHKPLDRV